MDGLPRAGAGARNRGGCFFTAAGVVAKDKHPDDRFSGTVALEEIAEPGAYVCQCCGDLIRVVDALTLPGDEAFIQEHGGQAVRVSRLSGDPFVPITWARMEAANLDLKVSF